MGSVGKGACLPDRDGKLDDFEIHKIRWQLMTRKIGCGPFASRNAFPDTVLALTLSCRSLSEKIDGKLY
jgi:hypothetical protein